MFISEAPPLAALTGIRALGRIVSMLEACSSKHMSNRLLWQIPRFRYFRSLVLWPLISGVPRTIARNSLFLLVARDITAHISRHLEQPDPSSGARIGVPFRLCYFLFKV